MTTAKDSPTKIPRDVQNAAAWAAWRGTAQKFKGLGQQLEARHELRNIRLQTNGYQVVFGQKSNYLSRSFAGFGEASLQRAMRFRDEVERERGPAKRINRVPPAVLHALGLTEEIAGICRLPSRSVYRIYWTEADGRRRLKQFYFRRVPEADAYAAAINFVRDLKASKS